MKLASFEAIVRALNEAKVRYLVAGGLAVNAHGYERLTHDVDLVVQLDRDNVLRAFEALQGLGYRPRVPVTAQQFADAAQRNEWIVTKGMKVLNLFSNEHPEAPMDLFVTEPFEFDHEYDAAMRGEIAPGLEARFVTIPTLMEMKRATGRARDADDVQHLHWLLEERQRRDR